MANDIENMTIEQYMARTRANFGTSVVRPTIDNDTGFKIKGQFLKELRDTPFNGSDDEDSNEHIEKVFEIADMFHVPKVTKDQVMLCIFPKTLVGAAKRWINSEPMGVVTSWAALKNKFVAKYCPPSNTAMQIEEIHNFKQEVDETLYKAWKRYKTLLFKCPNMT